MQLVLCKRPLRPTPGYMFVALRPPGNSGAKAQQLYRATLHMQSTVLTQAAIDVAFQAVTRFVQRFPEQRKPAPFSTDPASFTCDYITFVNAVNTELLQSSVGAQKRVQNALRQLQASTEPDNSSIMRCAYASETWMAVHKLLWRKHGWVHAT